MEKLARRLANKIALSLALDSEREAVIAYGLIAILQVFVTILIVTLLGVIIGALVESLIVCFSVSLLRKYSGGAHAQTAEFCTAITAVYCTLTAALSKYIIVYIYHPIVMLIAVILLYACSLWVAYRYIPVDSPNKPIKSPVKIKRMRIISISILIFYAALSGLFLIFSRVRPETQSFGISLYFGISWQMFTLTPVGAVMLHKLNEIFQFKERR